jgi:hypothetical protein
MVLSTISPITVELIKIENNIAYYKLRKDIQTVTSHNSLLDLDESLFQYEETDLFLTYTNDLQIDEIKNNFEIYWTLANKQVTEKQKLETKKQQIKDLIDNGNFGLLTLNTETKQALDTVLLGLMDAYDQILKLSTSTS